MTLKKILQTIKKGKRFLISTHVSPDPDALCSELALYMVLKAMGKEVHVVNEEKLPKRYRFLSGSSRIKSFHKGLKLNVDAALILDCGEMDRIGKVQSLLCGHETIINIDHHVTNDRFGDINLIDVNASSTAEVLYEFLKYARCRLNKEMAGHLYLGIMTDTGSFRYENTTSRTFEVVSELVKYGFSTNRLYQQVYDTIPFNDLREVAGVISDSKAVFSGKVIAIQLSKKILAKFTLQFDLRDTIFRFLRSVEAIEVIAILTELTSVKTRVNLRSNKTFDVAKLASLYGDGGHKRASGCMINKPLKEAQADLIKRIGSML